MSEVTFADVVAAKQRIDHLVHKTPVLSSHLLNNWLGHEIYFKAECLQKIGAFKIRGASNFLAKRHEANELPKKVVANSSGNHAQAVALAASSFHIPATIYTTENISSVKAAATAYYGAEVLKFANRTLADRAVQEAAETPETAWIPPFNHADIIAGQGTAALEALQEIPDITGIFAPVGGGGLLSGTLLATRELASNAEVIGCEPFNANDVAKSLRAGSIQSLNGPPKTLADGAATPCCGELTFPIIQQTDGFYEIAEIELVYWTQWLQHLLKLHVEPTSAMAMAGVARWLKTKNTPQKVMVMLSGGNISESSMRQIWEKDYLQTVPSLLD